jgi:hypothetical protein
MLFGVQADRLTAQCHARAGHKSNQGWGLFLSEGRLMNIELIFVIIKASITVASEFCYKAMIIVFALYLAVRWGII